MASESGFLIVAYSENDKDHETPKELAFEYWLAAEAKPPPPPEPEDEPEPIPEPTP